MIPLAAKRTAILGIPIGTNDFVHDAVRKELADCDLQGQKLILFPVANCFILLTRNCSNWKLIYLARNISPITMRPHAENFDSMIDMMLEKNFTLPLTIATRLENIVPST